MPIETLDPANSVLFLGSGFSAGAINIANDKVPTGYPLLERLASALDEDLDDLDLKAAADEFLSRSNLSLYELLNQTFTISNTTPHQKDIISLPWGRIYTTNYDDIVSVVKGFDFPFFTFDEPRPSKLPTAFAVHLHGSIRRASEENAQDQLILNSKSYDIITRQHQQWFHEFQRDRRTFDACYFMGFSLNDHHISSLMTSGEESVKRTYFVCQPESKASFVRRASEYGKVVSIGFERFAELAKTLPKPERPQDLNGLKSFKCLRLGLDAKPLADPTPVEIINLVSFGTFSQGRFFNTPNKDSYVSPRNKHVGDALESLKECRTLLIHSRLGNGKSIFTSILASRATTEGYVCLLWRRADRNLAQDLEVISEHTKILVIFDDYDAAIDNIARISAKAPKAKFVVTVRTSQHEVRLHEANKILPLPVNRLNLNVFHDEDREHFLTILKRAGAQVDGLEQCVKSASDIRDVVTQLYNHSVIREKLSEYVKGLPTGLGSIIVLSSLIKWVGVETDDNYIQELTGRDVYSDLRDNFGLAGDFLDLHDDKVLMRSSLLSEYFIQRIFSVKEILDGCFDIAIASTRRTSERVHLQLSGKMLQFSTLQRFLKFHLRSDEALKLHYARLSNDRAVNAEPLFWLQYSILMKVSGDIMKARMFLNTGYERAADIEGFRTFQLDTQSLSIHLLEEISRQNAVVEGLEDILKFIKIVTDMVTKIIDETSSRYQAIEVLGEVPEFIHARSAALTAPEKVTLVFELNRSSQTLAGLPIEVQAHSGSEIIRRQIEAAIVTLTG